MLAIASEQSVCSGAVLISHFPQRQALHSKLKLNTILNTISFESGCQGANRRCSLAGKVLQIGTLRDSARVYGCASAGIRSGLMSDTPGMLVPPYLRPSSDSGSNIQTIALFLISKPWALAQGTRDIQSLALEGCVGNEQL